MSIEVMTKVIQRAPVSGSEFTCMLIMANWCNDDGDSLYPSMDLLAEAMRVSRSQAKRVLRKLMATNKDDEAAGNWWFRVVGNENGGAPGMTRRYEMNVARLDTFPKLPEFAKADDRRQQRVETGRAGAAPKNTRTGRTHAPPSAHQTGRTHAPPRGAPMRPDSSVEPSVSERECAREEEEFEAARKAWPTGFADSREEALAAWLALNESERGAGAAEIGRYVSTTKAIGRKFFGTFASFLSERKWQALPERSGTGKPFSSGTVSSPPTPPKSKFLQDYERRQAEESGSATP